MVRFLLNKPIAVSMTYIALVILGISAMLQLPVSIMPNIAIPEITVQVQHQSMSARELENNVVSMLRQQLMQVDHLEDIKSETINGSSKIKLFFTYGTDINYAFIEVNEKVDRAMGLLPRSFDRPKVMKASASDIPVFYLNLTLKNPKELQGSQIYNELYPVSDDFVQLSEFAGNVISKRLEQLPEIALVDMSGMVSRELLIVPDEALMEALGITHDYLREQIVKNNLDMGNLSINDGQYRYNIRFDAKIQTKADLETIYLKSGDRLLQLKDIANIIEHPRPLKGMVLSNNQEAITMALIKQADAQMNDLKESLHRLVKHFEKDYPDIRFEITRDQTSLLDYSIKNLGQTLWWGGLLAFGIMFLFLKDFKSPLLIGLTIPVSLIISLLFFYLFDISINIISLSGLVLGVGMMIDNSIIVIDNITQHYERLQVSNPRLHHFKPDTSVPETETNNIISSACITGTNEVFRPMLTSVLTTCAVFIPLIFIKGIAGSLFYDQAMAIAIGLMVSLLVSITLLPVFYRLFYLKTDKPGKISGFFHRINVPYQQLYEKGFRFTLKNQPLLWVLVALFLTGAVLLYYTLPKSQFPEVAETEVVATIDWNEPLSLNEIKHRSKQIYQSIHAYLSQATTLIGEQQFILNDEDLGNQTTSAFYLKVDEPVDLLRCKHILQEEIRYQYPQAMIAFKKADNIFNIIASNEAPFEIRLQSSKDFGNSYKDRLIHTLDQMGNELSITVEEPGLQQQMILQADPEKMLIYAVDPAQLVLRLKSMFNANEVMLIASNKDFIPVVLGSETEQLSQLIDASTVINKQGEPVPIRILLEQKQGEDLKKIVAGKSGEYYPITLAKLPERPLELMKEVKTWLQKQHNFEAAFTGSYFSNKTMIIRLSIILIISLLLLYFILAAQFESLVLPIIVLLEVPIDIFGALLMLKLFGSGINLMSLIGIIVMSGIVINDSILKIDTIIQLRKQGNGLIRSIALAGQRRLKPILMTSITTILALIPFLFIGGPGSDMQRPLALAVIGGMTLGTLVSLYFIPLSYYYLNRHSGKIKKMKQV